MSFAVVTYKDYETPSGKPTMNILITSDEDIQLFKQLVNRAMNCWDRAPAKIKEFGDLVTEGKIQQKYQDLGSEVKS